MEASAIPHIVDAARSQDGILVTLDDGRCAVYSASLLLTIFPQADEVIEVEEFQT